MRLSPGDIVEIETTVGLAYAQITHIHPSYPEVVRVLSGFYSGRPGDLHELSISATAFISMFPLASAIEMQKLIGRRVASFAVPDEYKAFPTFKMPIHDKQGDVVYWWLWEEDGLSYRIDVDGSCDKYPLREVPTTRSFLGRIVQLQDSSPAQIA